MKSKSVFTQTLVSVFLLVSACNSSDFETAQSGIQYKYLKRGAAKMLPRPGEMVFCHYIIETEEGVTIFNSYTELQRPDRIPMQTPAFSGDIFDALQMMSIGDSMQFLISADSFYSITRKSETLPQEVKPGSNLVFTIKMEDIMSEEDYKTFLNQEQYQRWVNESQAMDSFFRSQDWKDTKLENGLRYFINQETNGTPVVKGKEVTFHFIGTVLSTGTEFSNSYFSGKPARFVVGDPAVRPEIMTLMLMQLKEGEKATFLVPFDHAFAERGLANLVPPYATVIYEVNLLSVE